MGIRYSNAATQTQLLYFASFFLALSTSFRYNQTYVPYQGEAMPVNYLTLTQEIKKLGEQSLQRSVRLSEKLNQCRELLRQNASQTRLLEQKVEEAVARDSGIRCAKPCGENLDTHRADNSSDELCTILAADGSQITPNAHEPVLFGLVNGGGFSHALKCRRHS